MLTASDAPVERPGHDSNAGRLSQNDACAPIPTKCAFAVKAGTREIIFDQDSNAVDERSRRMFIKRFIHGEIYS